LKPEWWGSPLVQEKYREERLVTRDDNTNTNNNNNNNNNNSNNSNNNNKYALICKYRIAETLYRLETWFVLVT